MALNISPFWCKYYCYLSKHFFVLCNRQGSSKISFPKYLKNITFEVWSQFPVRGTLEMYKWSMITYTFQVTFVFRFVVLKSSFRAQTMSWEASRYLGSQECPTLHDTRRFITVFPTGHHLSLLWGTLILSTLSHPVLRGSLILPSYLRLRLPVGFCSSGLPSNILYEFLFSLVCATWFDSITLIVSGNTETHVVPHYAIFSSVLYVLHLRYRRTLSILFLNPPPPQSVLSA